MKKSENHSPPKWASMFLKFYCKNEVIEEIQGDLLELFHLRVEELGLRKAQLRYIWDIMRFLKWSNIKKAKGLQSNFGTMLTSYLVISRRNLWREKEYSIFNLIGLYVGFLSLILTAIYVDRQVAYDTHHIDSEDTYRLVLIYTESGSIGAATAGPWAPAMKDEFPEIRDFVRVGNFNRSVFEYDNRQFYEEEGILADSSFFEIFSYNFKWGNSESALSEPFTMVISEEMALKYFGDRNPVGDYIEVNNQEQYKITGVLDQKQSPSHVSFDFVVSFDSHQDDFRYDWIIQNYTTYIQVRKGADVGALGDKLGAFFKRHIPDSGVPIHRRSFDFEPIEKIHLFSKVNNQEPNVRRVMIFGVMGVLILIIALLNYVNLVTARSTQRQKEVGVRKAIGARKNQLVIQFLSESFFFCFTVFVLSMLSVKLFLPAYQELVGDVLNFGFLENTKLILLLLGVTLVASLLSGFYPAIVLSAIKPINLIGGKGKGLRNANIFRYSLTGVQFAISIGLIIAVVFINLQLDYMNQKDLGFDKSEVMVVPLRNTSILPNRDSFADRLEASPLINSVGISGHAIGGGDWGMSFRYEGGSEVITSRFMAIDAEFANTLKIDFVAGRNFSEELATDVDNSYIVNETFLKTVGWPDGIGKTIEMPTRNPDGIGGWAEGTIVGVVKDFNFHNLRHEISPLVMSNRLRWTNILFIKLDREDIIAGVAEVERQWKEIESELPFNYYFLDDRIGQFYEQEAHLSTTATIYGVVAILLACFGLFSLATFVAEQRMKEVSIRKVLGASVQQVFFMFSSSFLRILIISSVIAVPIILYVLNGWLTTFAYRIEIWDHAIVPVFAVLVTLAIALITILYQCMRLIKVNPVQLLKSE